MISSEIEDFIYRNYTVSRETVNKLEEFYNLLLKWNKVVHLISNNESEHLWERHILDCCQLMTIIPDSKNKVLTDFGSGTGFPGIIIALTMEFAEINLVESNKKKALFLEEAARLSNTKINIIAERIENIPNLNSDIITARAFADLDTLLYYANMHSKVSSEIFTFKGKKLELELLQAKKKWQFEYNQFPSNILNDSLIVGIRNFEARKND